MESKLYVYINLLFVSQGCDSRGGFGLAGVKADAFLSRLSAWLPPCPANVLPPHTPVHPSQALLLGLPTSAVPWKDGVRAGGGGGRGVVSGVHAGWMEWAAPKALCPWVCHSPPPRGVLGRGSVIQADGGMLGGMWRLRAAGWGPKEVCLGTWMVRMLPFWRQTWAFLAGMHLAFLHRAIDLKLDACLSST